MHLLGGVINEGLVGFITMVSRSGCVAYFRRPGRFEVLVTHGFVGNQRQRVVRRSVAGLITMQMCT